MSKNNRRENIISILNNGGLPVSGSDLSDATGVSRQIIVKDIAMLKADGHNIISTNKGYVLFLPEKCTRIFKVKHSDEQIEDELSTIVSYGGTIVDVFVKHNIYGDLKATLNISTIKEVKDFINKMESGEATPLKNVTDNIHYHTVTAINESILDEIESALSKKSYLQKVS